MAFMMLLRRPPLLATVIVSSMLAGCLAVSVVLAPKPVTLATGTPGGIYFPVGNAICRMFNLPSENLPKPCVAVPTDGSVANIGRVERGESAFGLSQTDIAYAAVHGEGPFAAAGAAPKLRLLLTLYPETFTAVARADTHIRDFEDLRGKRIGIGKSGNGYTYTLGVLLESFGWVIRDSERVQEFDPAEQNEALCDNKVDAIIFVTGHPNGLTQEATTRCRAKLVRVGGPLVERLLATHSYYTASVIPGGMYARNPDDIPTISTLVVLVTSSDQPDELAYRIVKAVFKNLADFRRLHPALATLDIKDMVPNEAVIPIHPGALRYYREAALLP